MNIPFDAILAFAVGFAVMALLGYLLLVPMKFLWRMAAGGVLGAIALAVINFFGSMTGFTVAINPFTALTVGLLGLPGALLIAVLSFYIL